jgi:hypothetical protein
MPRCGYIEQGMAKRDPLDAQDKIQGDSATENATPDLEPRSPGTGEPLFKNAAAKNPTIIQAKRALRDAAIAQSLPYQVLTAEEKAALLRTQALGGLAVPNPVVDAQRARDLAEAWRQARSTAGLRIPHAEATPRDARWWKRIVVASKARKYGPSWRQRLNMHSFLVTRHSSKEEWRKLELSHRDWKPALEYEVSSRGRVREAGRHKALRPRVSKRGVHVSIPRYVDRTMPEGVRAPKRYRRVHIGEAMLCAFVSKKPSRGRAVPKNGDPQDLRLENWMWEAPKTLRRTTPRICGILCPTCRRPL